MLNEKEQYLTEKENFFEDDKPLSDSYWKIGKYNLQTQEKSKTKEKTASNHLDNEGYVSNINQCKYGNHNGNQNYDHSVYYKNHKYRMYRNH